MAWLSPILAAILAVTVLVPTAPVAQAKRPAAPASLASATIDAHLGYQAQSTCSPSPKPGATALLKLLIKTWGGGSSGIYRGCGVGGTSEHKEGRALDWRMSVKSTSQRKRVDQALAWLTANNGEVAYRLGVMYIIWNQHIWSIYYPELGWRKMDSRGSVTANHKNHVHISLSWDGAYQQTSWWTGVPVTQPLNSKCGVNGARACLPLVARTSAAWPYLRTTVPSTFLPFPWTQPGIGGSPQVGRTVTAVPGTWVPTGATLSYQWTADKKPIAGANQPTYLIGPADVGTEIRVEVTAATAAGPLTKTSDELAEVYRGWFANTSVGIIGTVAPDQVVQADLSSWTPAPTQVSYRWLRDGKAIAGATAASYRVGAADANRKLSVKVTVGRAGYATTTVTSAATVVRPGFSSAPTPVLQGDPVVGNTLTADAGAWSPVPTTLTYQWLADGTPLAGATGGSLLLESGTVGKSITVVVQGSRAGLATVTVGSAAVVVADRPAAPEEPVAEAPAAETPVAETAMTPTPSPGG